MAFDESFAQIFRDALGEYEGTITERKMFGGLCFMLNGNMLCGVNGDGGMARVGKENEQIALKIDGIEPLSFTGRRMGGFVDVPAEVLEDDARLEAVLSLCFDFVGQLPPK